MASASRGVLELHCAKVGCKGVKRVPIDILGDPPPPCTLPHAGNYARPVLDEYASLVGELVRRRRSLGLGQADMDDVIGLPDRYVGKLEAMSKIASPPTLLLWAQSLGLHLTVAPAPLPKATMAAIERRRDNPYAESQVREKPRQIPFA